jgi:hypothetical protein
MSTTKRRLALAALLAALSTPALAADDAVCSVCGDPTFPALENPAPALTLRAQGGAAEALVEVDPTSPADAPRMPAIALVRQPVEEPGPAIITAGVPKALVRHVIVLGPPARQVAKAR